MRSRAPLYLLVLGLLAACGGDPPPPPYEVFTVELVELTEGQRVLPGTSLLYRTHYVGPLARNLTFTAVFTHEPSGQRDSFSWSEAPQDTARIDQLGRWFLRHPFLEKSGRIRVQLQASLTSTRNGSTPWVVESGSIYVELYPSLDRVELTLPASGQPLAYGAPLQVRVTGKDLWAPVRITVQDVEADRPVVELQRSLPFDGSQTSLADTWPLRAQGLERIGTHPLRVVAHYGDLQREAEPVAVQVTHTLDSVTVLLRDPEGNVGPPTVSVPRLPRVAQLGVRIQGTQLAGHDVTVNGGAPVRADGDAVDLLPIAPKAGDFEGGKGLRTYALVVRSGGIERTVSLTVQRWGIERCEWRSPEGRTLRPSEAVNRDTEQVMHAELWGFPDTSGWLFKSPRAKFTLWERDPGGRPTPEQVDSLKNNDDEGDSFGADVRSSVSEARWTTEYEDEFDLLDLHVNAAEYYFEVSVEDQVCTSELMLVY